MRKKSEMEPGGRHWGAGGNERGASDDGQTKAGNLRVPTKKKEQDTERVEGDRDEGTKQMRTKKKKGHLPLV